MEYGPRGFLKHAMGYLHVLYSLRFLVCSMAFAPPSFFPVYRVWSSLTARYIGGCQEWWKMVNPKAHRVQDCQAVVDVHVRSLRPEVQRMLMPPGRHTPSKAFPQSWKRPTSPLIFPGPVLASERDGRPLAMNILEINHLPQNQAVNMSASQDTKLGKIGTSTRQQAHRTRTHRMQTNIKPKDNAEAGSKP